MGIINKFFRNRLQATTNYFKNTPTFILFQTIFKIICSVVLALGYMLSEIQQNPYILIYILMIVICLLVIYLFYIERNSIRINDLYLEKDAFLINIITNILEVKRIKTSENINPVEVSELVVNYNIGEPNVKDGISTSDLNMEWRITGVTSNNQVLEKYDMIYCKSDTKRIPFPKVKVKKFNGREQEVVISENNTGLLNHFCANLANANISGNTNFNINIKLSNYYNFIWNECEVFVVNPNIYGKSVNQLKVNLCFPISQVMKTNISVYEINQTNLKRKWVHYMCYSEKKNTYFFESKDVSNKAFLIVIPKPKT